MHSSSLISHPFPVPIDSGDFLFALSFFRNVLQYESRFSDSLGDPDRG